MEGLPILEWTEYPARQSGSMEPVDSTSPSQRLWIWLCNGQLTVEYDFLFKNLPMRVFMHHLQEQDRWKLKTCGRPVHILTIWDGGGGSWELRL